MSLNALNTLEIRRDVLRRFNPRARVIAGAALLVVTVHISNIYILAGIIAVCLAFLCRDILRVIQRLVPLELLCALLAAQSLCGLLETKAACVYVLRINGAALVYMLFVITMGLGTLAQALGELRVSPKLVSILYLTHRYIYVMYDTVFCSVQAMRRRLPLRLPLRLPRRENSGGCGTLFLWKAYAAVFARALVVSFVKAGEVSAALISRGFDGAIPQTRVYTWRARDTILVIGAVTAAIAGVIFYGTYQTYKHFV